jgi:hypothetical protein
MASTQLRLRGVTSMQLAVGAVAAAPLVFVAVAAGLGRLAWAGPVPLLAGAAGVAALLPWLSRAVARASYRARFDDIAVHVRGEALPFRTITEVTVERTPRRTLLHLRRGETVELVLVLADLYAGRLEPLAPLAEKLAAHGHPLGDTLKPGTGDTL